MEYSRSKIMKRPTGFISNLNMPTLDFVPALRIFPNQILTSQKILDIYACLNLNNKRSSGKVVIKSAPPLCCILFHSCD